MAASGFPVPSVEEDRLDELYRYDVLDTPPEERFDRIARLAAQLFDVPIALVTIVDAQRQWLKSCFGFDRRETSRDVAFCAHTILSDDELVVEDATRDARFADNPLVTAAPQVRFYAGAPLVTPGGYRLGSLCVMDTTPRSFGETERAQLRDLAAMVVDELELRREVAEREKAEAALHQSEQKYRSFFELAGVPMLIFAPETEVILEANESAAALYRYPREELIGKSLLDLSKDPARGRKEVQRVLRTGTVKNVETVQYNKAGAPIHLLISASVIRYEGQQAILTINRDITQRKQAQAALQASEQRFRSLVSNLPGLVYRCTYDAAWTTLYMSRGFDAIGGYSVAAFERNEHSLRDLVVEEDLPRIRKAVRAAVAAQSHYEVEYRIRGRDGRVHWIEDVGRPHFDDDGRVLWLDGVMFDVTERRRAEERLLLLETAVNDMVESVLITDAELDRPGPRIVFANPGFESMSGYAPEEVIGKTPRLLQGPETDRALLDELRALLEDGESFFGETVNYRKDGAPFVIEWSISPVRDERGEVSHFVAVQCDVTERRHAEEKVRAALEKERELGRLKSRFVSMASHELRTPLATIQSSTELAGLFMRRQAIDRAEKHLDRIQRNIDKMTRLLEDVLVFGRAESGQLPFEPISMDLTKLVQELVRDIRQGIGAAHRVEVTGLDAPISIEADPQLVRLILSNLLSNAVKYSPEGGTVRLDVQARADAVVLAVADEGIGIPAADRDRLFEPFHRAENVGTRSGTGLGLSIAKEAADLHDGTITVDSAEGVGTTFTVRLPR